MTGVQNFAPTHRHTDTTDTNLNEHGLVGGAYE